jgi:hypothetical protein
MRGAVFAAAVVLGGSGGTKSLLAAPKDGRHEDHGRRLHVTKECSQYDGSAGAHCTITSSNVPQIAVGATVTYDQAAGIPAGLLDSNVILDAGGGNRAIGRCTLDGATGLGLCTFSDGTGDFAGFHARIRVSPPTEPPPPQGQPDLRDWHWNGAYGFGDDF